MTGQTHDMEARGELNRLGGGKRVAVSLLGITKVDRYVHHSTPVPRGRSGPWSSGSIAWASKWWHIIGLRCGTVRRRTAHHLYRQGC